MKQITLKIMPDGTVQAETHGLRGAACLDWLGALERLTGAQTVDSSFTEEYRQRAGSENELDLEVDVEWDIQDLN